jgi:hypothetical protein
MAISGKPSKPSPAPPAPPPNEHDVLNLIHKGGSVAKSAAPQTDARDSKDTKLMFLQLRLYPDLVEEIDAVRKVAKGKRYRPPSRHAWIVAAIEEKIARDKSSS